MKPILTVLFTIVSLFASAQSSWTVYDYDSETTSSYNTERSSREGSVITVWIKTKQTGTALIEERKSLRKVFGASSTIPTRYSYSIDKMQFNCSTNSSRLLKSILYDNDGKSLETFDFGESAEWNETIPDTRGSNRLNWFCTNIQ
ncbi:surface-adhesin E family protein [Flaviaesturariibacter aridisoli]|uniref:Surface-adhesin protein E-like domain-containing protein n=1 Tax=Flaviaesturariibacter aridisoli TaxID=2545761 RepID=A0A4R4E4Q5_9BACT|nr:surface-adhesin E family protein [Flaviaesturariibacter aridisoli]TCZ74594.1 hypothetical protein E0486_02935 [Flaviaesturariibacter aridisoli]